MIIGSPELLNDLDGLSVRIKKALDFILKTDFSNLKNGRYEIFGKDIIVNLFDSNTRLSKDIRAESHKNYIDLHYLISGKEIIEVGKKESSKKIGDYDPVEDSEFWELEKFDQILFTPGICLIFYPLDIHKAGCIVKESSKLRKLVIKIRAL